MAVVGQRKFRKKRKFPACSIFSLQIFPFQRLNAFFFRLHLAAIFTSLSYFFQHLVGLERDDAEKSKWSGTLLQIYEN